MRLACIAAIMLTATMATAGAGSWEDQWATAIGQKGALQKDLLLHWSMRTSGTTNVVDEATGRLDAMRGSFTINKPANAFGYMGFGMMASGNGEAISTAVPIVVPDTFTLGGWMVHTAANASGRSFANDKIYLMPSGGASHGYRILGSFGTNTWDVSTAETFQAGYSTSVYTHVMVVMSATNWTLFVDAVAVTQRAAMAYATTQTWYSGATTAGGSPYSGYLDELKVWGRALSPDEVAADMAHGRRLRRYTQ